MIGIALEGGGARGAYHVGVMKALYEAGYDFDGYCGTSIGAINAAALAQGDFDGLLSMWKNIEPTQLFAEPIARLMELGKRSFTGNLRADLLLLLQEIRDAGLGGGVDTSRMKALIRGLIDEQKLRTSGKLFALATVCISELRPHQLYLDAIPDGLLIEYLMASASFPGFEPEVIDKKTFVDGGLYNNCPVNLLVDKGFDQIIAIRTHGPGIYWLPETDASLTIIEPSRDLGNVMSFENALARRNIRIGYLDALRFLNHLLGSEYYLERDGMPDFGMLLMALDCSLLPPALSVRRALFEHTLPKIGARLKLSPGYTYDDLAIAILESAAHASGLEPLQILSLHQLAEHIASAPDPLDEDISTFCLAREIAIEIIRRGISH